MRKEKPEEILRNIHVSLDKAIQMGKMGYQEYSPSKVLNTIYSARITLAAHYRTLPYQEARKCKERLEIVEGIVEDMLERKRFEELMKWRKKK